MAHLCTVFVKRMGGKDAGWCGGFVFNEVQLTLQPVECAGKAFGVSQCIRFSAIWTCLHIIIITSRHLNQTYWFAATVMFVFFYITKNVVSCFYLQKKFLFMHLFFVCYFCKYLTGPKQLSKLLSRQSREQAIKREAEQTSGVYFSHTGGLLRVLYQ